MSVCACVRGVRFYDCASMGLCRYDDLEHIDKLTAVRAQVDQVAAIMTDNIVNMDDAIAKADQLNASSRKCICFLTSTVRLRACTCVCMGLWVSMCVWFCVL